MLYNVPIERLEERYSKQWFDWFHQEFNKHAVQYSTIYPAAVEYGKIQQGAFLDVVQTNRFKAFQLAELCGLFMDGSVGDGDTFFFHDLWFPGLEALAYIRQGLGMQFKIYGILHAGTYDEHDFLYRRGMDEWGKWIEYGWMQFVDGIFVGTNFHRNLLIEKRCVAPSKVHVTGLPIYKHQLGLPEKKQKENIIVFPHRLDPEKNPDHFDTLKAVLERKFDQWHFVRTKDVCRTKEGYYDLLAKSKVAISFSEQETWGIAMQEALMAGCIPLVPDRLSYREMYNPALRFSSFADLRDKLENILLYPVVFDTLKSIAEDDELKLMAKGETAIENMLRVMGVKYEWVDSPMKFLDG